MVQMDACIDRVAEVAALLGLANLEPQISACRAQCNGRARIDVAVFGRFKAGKSSFLNHLTGCSVLPIGVLPLTAVVTRLRAGETERAEVHFLDGSLRSIPVSELGDYVGESANPNNRKQVAAVAVELPALERLAPLEFVDTPGLGSAFAHNTQAAMKWLPNVGAAIVAASSDAPLSERDLGLMEELRRHTPRIILLLTKADLLSEPQRDEVLHFVRAQMRRIWNEEYPVFFYSVRQGLETLKERLEQELLLPLVRDRDVAANQIGRHKLLSLIGQALNYLRVAHAAATRADSARKALGDKLKEERQQFDLFRSELGVLAHHWSASALERYLERLQPAQTALQDRAASGLRAQFPTWRARLPGLLRAWREWLSDFLRRELGELSHARKAMFCEPLHQSRQHLTRTLRGFHDRLAAHVDAALGVNLTPRECVLEVQEPSAPPVDVGYGFDVVLDLAGYVVPMTLFRGVIGRALERKARWEVEKNISRLAAAWRDRVAASIRALIRQAEQEAFDELCALEHTLAQASSQAPVLKKAIEDLDAFERQLRAHPDLRGLTGSRPKEDPS